MDGGHIEQPLITSAGGWGRDGGRIELPLDAIGDLKLHNPHPHNLIHPSPQSPGLGYRSHPLTSAGGCGTDGGRIELPLDAIGDGARGEPNERVRGEASASLASALLASTLGGRGGLLAPPLADDVKDAVRWEVPEGMRGVSSSSSRALAAASALASATTHTDRHAQGRWSESYRWSSRVHQRKANVGDRAEGTRGVSSSS